jgi:hypothetical protein
MRIDLHVKCVLQKVSMFREMIDCFGFAKNRDAKQMISFVKQPPFSHVSLFCDTKNLALHFVLENRALGPEKTTKKHYVLLERLPRSEGLLASKNAVWYCRPRAWGRHSWGLAWPREKRCPCEQIMCIPSIQKVVINGYLLSYSFSLLSFF